MRIYCPNCKTGYEITVDLIPESGKKVRCGTCENIFAVTRSDLLPDPEAKPIKTVESEIVVTSLAMPDEETVNAELIVETVTEAVSEAAEPEKNPDEMKEIFERLSAQTEDLFKIENELPIFKKLALKLKRGLGLTSRSNRWIFLVAILALLGLSAYNFRFEMVRKLPVLSSVYQALGINAVIPGEGLEFHNIVWNKFAEDYVDKLEVKGFVVNPTDYEIELPTIHVELMDDDAVVLQELDNKPSITSLKPGSQIAISVIVKKPALTTKYVVLTFVPRK